MVKYTYNAWGKICKITNGYNVTISDTDTTHIANINPFRYRGYYYDVETKLYYLQSRYYDPEICRFINADYPEYCLFVTINDINYYAYCSNNPISSDDESGTVVSLVLKKIGSVILGVVLGIVSQFFADLIVSALKGELKFSSFGDYLSSAVQGGWDALWGGGLVVQICKSVLSNILGQIVDMIKTNKKFDLWKVVGAVFDGLIAYVVDKKIKAPKYIRDIKKKARKEGIKGLKKLTSYLNKEIRKITAIKLSISTIYPAVRDFLKGLITMLVSVINEGFLNLKKDLNT